MTDHSWRTRVFATRAPSGFVGWATTTVRVVTGVLFVTFSLGKFTDHAAEATDFEHYGLPWSDAAVYLAGTVELVAGALLIIGFLTRPAALALAANLVVAIATAGRVDGGTFHLGVGPALLVVCAFLVWVGSGALALDQRVLARKVRQPTKSRATSSQSRVDSASDS